MSLNFSETLQRDRRLAILRTLHDCGGTLNDSVLREALQRLGHVRLAKSVVREDVNWLEQRGLVKVEFFDAVQVATITERGADVASGALVVEGVKRPSVGE